MCIVILFFIMAEYYGALAIIGMRLVGEARAARSNATSPAAARPEPGVGGPSIP